MPEGSWIEPSTTTVRKVQRRWLGPRWGMRPQQRMTERGRDARRAQETTTRLRKPVDKDRQWTERHYEDGGAGIPTTRDTGGTELRRRLATTDDRGEGKPRPTKEMAGRSQ
jgi:hypothetical protein